MAGEFVETTLGRLLSLSNVGLGERVAAQDDEFDARLCLLAARDLLDGTAVGPRPDESALAVKEGWIWVRSN
jgi:hypothetical protein